MNLSADDYASLAHDRVRNANETRDSKLAMEHIAVAQVWATLAVAAAHDREAK